MQKKEIRQQLIKWRRELTDEERLKKDQAVFRHLKEIQAFQSAHKVLFYYSVNGETDTRQMILHYLEEKELYLPKIVAPDEFKAIPIKAPLQLEAGLEKVPEPLDLNADATEDKLDLIILPGVAFDKKGNRLGMGKGYYDRYLAKHKGIKRVALAYEEQVLDSIPKESYDEPVDIIVTDQNIYRCWPVLS